MIDNVGATMYGWARDLFPICRSLTGDGVRETLGYFQNILPDLRIVEVPTGSRAFDWTVPKEWNISDAYVADMSGNRIIDFQESNLHVVGYSTPVDRVMTFEELDDHLFSIPRQPDAIPYVTSYYEERWGFCLTETQRSLLRKDPKAKFKVRIDSDLKPGHMTYGELIIPGRTEKEILLSTYVCHPSMANNELSGPCVTAALASWLSGLSGSRYTYRVLFLVETLGAIVYLSRHLDEMKRNVEAGYVITCVGDENAYSYIQSRNGDALSEKVLDHVLKHRAGQYKTYSFLERRSDERQYCSPGVDLPVCTVCRSKFGEYPEYHTSLDDLSFISADGLYGSYDLLKNCLEILENNRRFRNKILCEPQLGRRGLYPAVSQAGSVDSVRRMRNFLAYADGTRDLVDLAETIGAYARDLQSIVESLSGERIIEIVDSEENVGPS